VVGPISRQWRPATRRFGGMRPVPESPAPSHSHTAHSWFEADWGHCSAGPHCALGPAHEERFSNISKLCSVYKIQKPTSWYPTILQTLYECRLTHYEQLYFWKQVQIRNRISIKSPRRKLLLNLGQIYWRFKHV
jgi:hypothetical protein